MATTIPRIDLRMDDLARLVDRARQTPLTEDEHATLKAAIDTLGYVAQLLEQKGTTLAGLRQLLFGAITEKTRAVLARAGLDAPASEGSRGTEANRTRPGHGRDRRVPGHGRHGAEAYDGAHRIEVPHPGLTHGDRCPACTTGKVYRQRDTLACSFASSARRRLRRPWTRSKSSAAISVENSSPPTRRRAWARRSYEATTGAMVALLKYGSGMPFYRLQQLQANLPIPFPASTQWAIVAETAERIRPAWDALIREAAQGEIVHNDDTSITVLDLVRPDAPRGDPDDVSPDRTGVFTSGIVATRDAHRIALCMTGRRPAGENLARVLAERMVDLGPPIQLCDALTRHLPKPLAVIVGHCLAHARRRFVDVTPSVPAACRHVLETLREVYRHDAAARAQGLTPVARLAFHRAHSEPLMTPLHAWLTAQIEERHVEPNSGLGQAIGYLLNHWTPLTLFLRHPAAPLDNNVCERALKKAILHRKNALFFKTTNGAQVGDLFMSLIHTCELAGANPFDYLTALQRHPDALAKNPTAWLPWNYQATLTRLGAAAV